MYSGFVTHKRVVKGIGIHQKFDTAAYRMIEPYLKPGTFPANKDILHFEGINGPDGLKVKSPGVHEPSHLYDPANDTGEVPMHITNHYKALVKCLRKGDIIRAAFEASWMAHYITDGLTPAHHFALEEEIAKLREDAVDSKTLMGKNLVAGEGIVDTAKRNWAMWGAKGLLSTHVNFEVGVATAMLPYRVKTVLSNDELAKARKDGYLDYFKQQARDIDKLDLYTKFIKSGWTVDMAQTVRHEIAPRTAQTIAVTWLLAYLEAGQQDLTEKK